MTTVSDDDLLDDLLGDTPLPAEFLADPEIQERMAELEAVLRASEAAPVPHRPADYGALVWRQLENKLRRESARTPRFQPAWRLLAAAVLLLGIGFLAGRLMHEPAPPVAAEARLDLSGSGRARLLEASVSRHLGASERLLTEFSNASANAPEDSSEKEWAEELLRANRLYRQAALRAGQTRIAALLAELEPIFLELAHTPAASERDDLKRRVDDRGLLLKVRVTEGRLSDRPNV